MSFISIPSIHSYSILKAVGNTYSGRSTIWEIKHAAVFPLFILSRKCLKYLQPSIQMHSICQLSILKSRHYECFHRSILKVFWVILRLPSHILYIHKQTATMIIVKIIVSEKLHHTSLPSESNSLVFWVSLEIRNIVNIGEWAKLYWLSQHNGLIILLLQCQPCICRNSCKLVEGRGCSKKKDCDQHR